MLLLPLPIALAKDANVVGVDEWPCPLELFVEDDLRFAAAAKARFFAAFEALVRRRAVANDTCDDRSGDSVVDAAEPDAAEPAAPAAAAAAVTVAVDPAVSAPNVNGVFPCCCSCCCW